MPESASPLMIKSRRDLLYRLGLVAGLGSKAGALADRICHASRGAWAQEKPRHDRTGINGGSPLEVSVRSDRWPELRYATGVGGSSWSAGRRLQEGIAAYRELATYCFDLRGQSREVLEALEAWCREVDSSTGDFGCYLSGSHSPERVRMKLYLDLFSGGVSRRGLTNWVGLLRSCQGPAGELELMEALLPVARPVLGCLEQSAEGPVKWRLYWRLQAPSVDTFRTIGAVMSVSSAVCEEIHDAFEYAAGGPTRRVPTTGFVHPVPIEPGTIVFYSTAPSRWGRTEEKGRRIREIWTSWGGGSTVLMRVWRLVKGARKEESWAPFLTLLGLGLDRRRHRRASAYFRVM